jgi:hypothetical protein
MAAVTDQLLQPADDQLYTPPELFKRGISAIAELVRTGTLRLLVGAGYRRFQFELHEREADDVLQRHHMSLSDLRRVLVDIDDVLAATAAGTSAERFAAARSDPERFEDGEVESPAIARSKYAAVTQVFDVGHLQRRVWLKSSVKIDLPSRIDWEILTKHSDADLGEPPDKLPVVYAALRIASEPADSPPFVGGNQVTMAVDAEDVDFLLDALTRLRQALKEADIVKPS